VTRYDLVVIGSGPAGHHAAIQAAKLGKSVMVVEAQPSVGGVCLNTGTIPSKTLREVVLAICRARTRGVAPVYSPEAWDAAVREILARCHHVVRTEVEVYRAQFARNRVHVLHGSASFAGADRIVVEGGHARSEVAASRIVIATGTVPARSPLVPVDGRLVVDSDSILGLRALPRSMIIVGGGIVGLEYASIFAALGVAVTVVDLRPRLLEFADAEIVEALCFHMRDAGVVFRLGEEVESVTTGPSGSVVAHLKSRKQLPAGTLLYAVGRHGNTGGLDLGAVGIETDARGRIPVDVHYRTAVPHVYAVGDVIGFPGLASAAMEQGRLAVRHAFGCPVTERQDQAFPYGIYTIPEISFVGRTEAELTAAGVPYEMGVAHYREIARGQIMGDVTGRLKLLFHAETGTLLGVHIIGEGASELIHIGQAVLAHGSSIEYFVDSVFNYPTLAECYKVAALAGINRLTPRGAGRGEAGRVVTVEA
jgi:NAD(P) transhydrogenase